ncbi:hypothetical protein BD770DRAFT_389595 [Pilaira anomala]|nr:hypothetical protein BD770DRAFT_389595 [Pilaira anomala]
MGCCSSIPQEEEEPQTLSTQPKQVTKTRTRLSLDSLHAEKKIIQGSSTLDSPINTSSSSSSSPPPPPPPPAPLSPSNNNTCKIFIRLSNNGKDIPIQIPNDPPYLTVAGLHKDLLPHLENNTDSTRVKLIYLGRILPDHHLIVPTTLSDPDSPLPPTSSKKSIVQIQKESVIQAMVTYSS